MRARKIFRIISIFSAILFILALTSVAVTFGSLENSSWQLDHIVINNVRQSFSPTRFPPSLHFEGFAVNGNGGCNNFSGKYVPLVLGRLKFFDLSITKLGCVSIDEQSGETINLGAFEPIFMEAIGNAYRVEINGQTMHVYFGSAESDILVFLRAP